MDITFDLEDFGISDAGVGTIVEGTCIVTATIEISETYDPFKRRMIECKPFVEDCDFDATLGISCPEGDKAISTLLKRKYGYDEKFREAVNDQAMRELVKEQAA